MKFIIKESQSKIYMFVRRMNTPKMEKIFKRLILEATWANSIYLSSPFEVYLDKILSWASYNIVAQDDNVFEFGYEFDMNDEKSKHLVNMVYNILKSKYEDEIHESYEEKLYAR